MKAGEILILISYSINFISLIVLTTFNQNNDKFQCYLYISYALCLVLSLCGYGLHVANVLQFGASQLQFASSDDFAAFARWGNLYHFSQFISCRTDSNHPFNLYFLSRVIKVFLVSMHLFFS